MITQGRRMGILCVSHKIKTYTKSNNIFASKYHDFSTMVRFGKDAVCCLTYQSLIWFCEILPKLETILKQQPLLSFNLRTQGSFFVLFLLIWNCKRGNPLRKWDKTCHHWSILPLSRSKPQILAIMPHLRPKF